MDIRGKQALVTGGAAGIGLAVTRALSDAGGSVLIVGRDQTRLNSASAEIPRVTTFSADLSRGDERERLIDHVSKHLPTLDILVNNAGTMQYFALTRADAAKRLESELALDLHAPIYLTTALLPGLLARPQAAIVNVTTGLVYAPFGITPGYSAAKGGLHAFTRALRWQTRHSRLRIIELMPPAVRTDLTNNYNGPKISPEKVANDLIKGLVAGRDQVRPGMTKTLYALSRIAPHYLFNAINKAADKTPLDP